MVTTSSRRARGSPSIQKKHARFNEPKKEKRIVKTNVIFTVNHDRLHKLHRKASPLVPKRRSLASESNGVLNDYRDQVSTEADQSLNHTYKELVQRLDQTTLQPDGLAARISQAAEAGQAITAPLAKDTVKVRYKDQAGNSITRQIAIGETVSSFENKVEEKRRELETLWEEWSEVRQEIADLGAQILQDPELPVEFGMDTFVGRPGLDSRSAVNREIADIRDGISIAAGKARRDAEHEAQEAARAQKELSAEWLRQLQLAMN